MSYKFLCVTLSVFNSLGFTSDEFLSDNQHYQYIKVLYDIFMEM